jgi:hypothetical protein
VGHAVSRRARSLRGIRTTFDDIDDPTSTT